MGGDEVTFAGPDLLRRSDPAMYAKYRIDDILAELSEELGEPCMAYADSIFRCSCHAINSAKTHTLTTHLPIRTG